MNKQYIAVVSGKWPISKKLVDAPLLKTNLASGERIVLVDDKGKASQTRFELLENLGDYSLIKAKPLSGRTHQIRVHARHCFCPLLGDEKYSDLKKDSAIVERLKIKTFMLHAKSLSFTLPENNQLVEMEAPLPITMLSIIESLREY